MGIKKKALAISMAGTLLLGALPTVATAADNVKRVPVMQSVGAAVLKGATVFTGVDPSTKVTIDIVMKLQNQDGLAQFINDTTTPGNKNYRKYLKPTDFAKKYAPSYSQIYAVTKYFNSYGIRTSAYSDNLIITATGTAGQFNKAFNMILQNASLNGKSFHMASNPTLPSDVWANVLCVLGLTDYSDFQALSVKDNSTTSPSAQNNAAPTPDPTWNMPQNLEQNYNATPLYKKANGYGQTIGIVTLADFNISDANYFWKYAKIATLPNRITKYNVDGGAPTNEAQGSDETTLDVEQSGALAPDARINVYVAPNTDYGFVDGFAKAINDNKVQQISASWGQSESSINYWVGQGMEAPQYAQAFNELFMQGAAQGISMFTAAGDSGAYDSQRDMGTYDLGADNPADSPYITAAGGTTLPYSRTLLATNPLNKLGTDVTVTVDQERAWGYDYYFPILDAFGYSDLSSGANWTQPASPYFEGGGGGFSTLFNTPDYQVNVPGVNTYTAVQNWTYDSGTNTITRNNDPLNNLTPQLTTGTGSGRNVPDLSMDADPHSGYAVYASLKTDGTKEATLDTGWGKWGGTSFVAPQLAGLSALINSYNHSQTGFWNPQLYRYAVGENSPLHPLNDSGDTNDNGFYTGTPGTVYNQATGLGTPDIAALAQAFKSNQ